MIHRPCPTCGHRLDYLGGTACRFFWCPSCGTSATVSDHGGRVQVPGEVARLRALVESLAARVAGQSELLARRAEGGGG